MDDPNRDPSETPPDEPGREDPDSPLDSQDTGQDDRPEGDAAPEEPDFSSTWIPAEEDMEDEPAEPDWDESVPEPDMPDQGPASDWELESEGAEEEVDMMAAAAGEPEPGEDDETDWENLAAGATAAGVGLSAVALDDDEAVEGSDDGEALVEEEGVEEQYRDEEKLSEWDMAAGEEDTEALPAQKLPEEKPPDDSTRLYNWLLVILGVLFLLSVCFLGYIFFSGRGQQPEDTPQAATPTSESGAAGDPTWDRIQAAGRVVSGTSGDYPPFAFYNDRFQLDGFDVALLNEVTRRLNFQGVTQDIAFDGLQNALAVGQIDMAAAAISRTPEREQVVAFSDVYYANEDAFLTREGYGLTVSSTQSLAGQRVAVERDTVFENWAQDNLVAPGLITQDQLLVYHQVDPAVNDLRLDRADVVILDRNVANEYLAAGGLSLAGSGLNPQYYAIAMQPDATTLLANVNQALAAMQQDGTLSQLVQSYLGQTSGVIPPVATATSPPAAATATPPPTPTTAPCIDAMQFVEDLSYDDEDMTNPPVLRPGESFRKGWRLRNTGTCTWDPTYRMVYVGGNVPAAQMGGQPTPVTAIVPPGATFDMYVNLTAPFTTGLYQGFWQLQNGNGLYFGSRVWVGIFVSPTGEIPTENPPVIQTYIVEPLEINTGGCVNISWQVEGQITNILLQVNGQDLQNNAPSQGGTQHCPAAAGTYEYRLTARGPGGDTAQSRSVVARDEAPTPPPPQPEPPVINAFTAQPSTVNVGQCTDLSWNVTGDVELVRILRNGTLAFDTLPAQGFGQDCFQNSAQVQYELQASGVGQTVTAQQQVTVNLVASYVLMEMLNSEGTLAGLVPNTNITLEINNEQISGSGGCNTYTSSYQTSGEELAVNPPVSTQLACDPPEVMTQEGRYFELLTQANRFHVTGDRLELIRETIDPATNQPVETILLVFESLAPQPR